MSQPYQAANPLVVIYEYNACYMNMSNFIYFYFFQLKNFVLFGTWLTQMDVIGAPINLFGQRIYVRYLYYIRNWFYILHKHTHILYVQM